MRYLFPRRAGPVPRLSDKSVDVAVAPFESHAHVPGGVGLQLQDAWNERVPAGASAAASFEAANPALVGHLIVGVVGDCAPTFRNIVQHNC